MKAAFPILALLLLTGCQGYKIENGKWSLVEYNEGFGRMVTPVKGADQNSFVPINRAYAKDSKFVYWDGVVIRGADPGTFAFLGAEYGRDSQKVFFREKEVRSADPDTFKIINGPNLWSRDKKDFYLGEHPVGVMDLDSFKILKEGWARDKMAYYAIPYFNKIGKVDCDYSTMKILSWLYAVDKNRAYYAGIPIEGVDVKTFRVTSSGTAKDKYHKYRGQRVLPPK